jgi:hypothetical protein
MVDKKIKRTKKSPEELYNEYSRLYAYYLKFENKNSLGYMNTALGWRSVLEEYFQSVEIELDKNNFVPWIAHSG